jgi:uncharacterized protein YycO
VAELQADVEHRNKAEESITPLGDSFGNPSGQNNFDYSSALWGDILLVHEGTVPWGYFRHIGMFDSTRYVEGVSPIIEADPALGVHFAPTNKFLHYDQQFGLKPLAGYGWVAQGALRNAITHLGKPYSYDFLNKWRTDILYCSSLVWRAYYDASGWDLDSTDGGFVSPDDIYYSHFLVTWQVAH